MVLSVVEVLILWPQPWRPPFMTGWVEDIDISKVSVLPPALIAVLLAYAKWQNQQDPVRYGGSAALILAPFVAVRAIPIDNFPTFGLVLFCLAVAGVVAVKHIPWRSRLDWAKILFFSGFLFLVVPWLMLETLGADRTPRPVALVFLGLFMGAILLSVLLFVLDDIRRAVAIAVAVGLTVLVLAGIGGAITALGLDESHPAMAEAIVYTALIAATVLLTVYLILKGNVSRV